MRTELCLRTVGTDRVLASVVLPGAVGLSAAVDTPQAAALAAAHLPRRGRPSEAADYGCYWTRQDCR